MSFSYTPLANTRRLEHSKFLNKPPSGGPAAANPLSLPPTSYTYGAPTSGSRASSSPNRERTQHTTDPEDEPALAKFARLKSRDQTKTNESLQPEKWGVKDTSVNIAGAFTQAANSIDMNTPNNAWASGSARPVVAPRSSSVEYEAQVQATSFNKRLAPPPSRRGNVPRKPVSRNDSLHVPDSEEEGERQVNGRATSPFPDLMQSAKRLKETASFYLKQRLSPQPPDPQKDKEKENESSYDYEAEEREFQQNSQATSRRINNASTHKRNRMSVDNKAYRPSVSDEESDDEDFEEDGKTRRKKKKKKDLNGLSLPIISADKRKKRRPTTKGRKGVAGEDEEEEQSVSEEEVAGHAQHTSIREPPLHRQHSLPRGSVPRELVSQDDPDASLDIEQGLDSIPEVDEDELQEQSRRRSASRGPPSPSFIGGPLGNLLNLTFRVALGILKFVVSIFFISGSYLGRLFDAVLRQPIIWAAHAGTSPGVRVLAKYLLIGLVLSSLYVLRDPLAQYIPLPSLPSSLRTHGVYTAPDVPATNLAEFAERLQRIETALSELSQNAERIRRKEEHEAREKMDITGRLVGLENKVVVESRRMVEAETTMRNTAKDAISTVKQDIEVLQAQLQAAAKHQQQPSASRIDGPVSDEEARAKVKAMEEKMVGIEGGVKEALELGRKAVAGTNSGPSNAWWNKILSGSKSGLSIKSSDGQDVTSLIGHLVDSAVATHGKDFLARPDFALHSGGARVIPSLTSPTFEVHPEKLRSQLLGLVTGSGYAIGHPPVFALHPDLHNGRCWPFAGQNGQLGVALAAPTYITDVTIDHVAKEVAFDMRSAPREMELWGLVEGVDNILKVQEWMLEKSRLREEARERGEEVEEELKPPKTLPKALPYVRIANFKYNINAPQNVQTFPVDQELRALGVDFGVVVLTVKSNWGREDYTCLYRLRVHGQRMDEAPLPYTEEVV